MKYRTLTALACAMVLSLSAVGIVFAGNGQTEQGYPTGTGCQTAAPDKVSTDCSHPTPTPTQEATSTPSDGCTCTEAPTPKPTPTPSDNCTCTETPTSTPSQEATSTPSQEATSSASDAATPSSGVEGATGTPGTTLPPTDSVSGGTGNGSGGLPIALLAMAGLLSAALLLTPTTLGIKRGKRRD